MANVITVSRLIPLALVAAFFYFGGPAFQVAAVPLILVLLSMDFFDGLVARRTGRVTKLGSTLDIAMDRLVEIILWVCFADLDLIPVWVPLIVIARGMIVDAVRGYALSFGQTAFGMMHSRLGRFLVSSRFMRDWYGATKLCAFLTLASVHALRRGAAPKLENSLPWLYTAGLALTMLAVALCLARGVPVLFDARALFRKRLPEEK
jgi:CDP-diacylglycerol--glycerol-3-phosphate 3-phosphatidyltransferase